ncbi:unnamed protein product [Tuber aestivum]|uniref:Uncharacterized protein n=1 Tax=Tuber aestivum TaxID=59557 RepID=A0A292Q702_9PEZI|nr:unnamed protein product [Tuber aestivum]
MITVTNLVCIHTCNIIQPPKAHKVKQPCSYCTSTSTVLYSPTHNASLVKPYPDAWLYLFIFIFIFLSGQSSAYLGAGEGYVCMYVCFPRFTACCARNRIFRRSLARTSF